MQTVRLTKSQIEEILAGKYTTAMIGDTAQRVYVALESSSLPPDWRGLAAFDNMKHPLNDEQSDGGAGGIIQGWK